LLAARERRGKETNTQLLDEEEEELYQIFWRKELQILIVLVLTGSFGRYGCMYLLAVVYFS
jgi:hypothetical protein